MPLLPGNTKEVIAQNIKKELSAGKPRKQAIAIALHNALMSEHRKQMSSGIKLAKTRR